ncbi:DNA cytosine methyltransferase [Ruminiclostridium papyrosolvens]|uniref:DNA cytosine methyltransferase n=1 Tax=Ruminiclostridium papyrosolvens TaxID=29362 RepID=UPI0004179BF5|nr:DNA cytosine methyltransferase [Ruminiclostridium papyrosolvens]
MITIGSLFDGISGFPLAGERLGTKSIWASEIEPFPIKVSTIRFPDMKQVGDITKINVDELESVDIVTGGSPCQDLSVAGKRAGLAGTRSGLFMEQIRIIKELRNKNGKNSGTNGLIRPRFMVWENVPGAFSSNKGEDFRAVLEETARIADETVTIPKPPKGKWNTFGAIMGNGWSIAWRVLDAQYWGVPQRRRRIFLVADFGGQSAPEILFKREGLSRHITKGRKEGKGTATDVERSVGKASGADIYNYSLTGDKACTLNANSGSSPTHSGPSVLYESHPMDSRISGPLNVSPTVSVKFAKGCADTPLIQHIPLHSPCPTLDASYYKGTGERNGIERQVIAQKVYGADLSQKAEGICFKEEVATCVNTGTHGGHGNNVITYQKVTGPLMANSHPGSYTGQDAYNDMFVTSIDCINHKENMEVSGTLCSKNKPGYSLNYQNPVRVGYSVRRLTPLECERLQDYPDGWTDIPGASDSARYKALGNSVAVCCPEYVLEGIKEVIDREGEVND